MTLWGSTVVNLPALLQCDCFLKIQDAGEDATTFYLHVSSNSLELVVRMGYWLRWLVKQEVVVKNVSRGSCIVDNLNPWALQAGIEIKLVVQRSCRIEASWN